MIDQKSKKLKAKKSSKMSFDSAELSCSKSIELDERFLSWYRCWCKISAYHRSFVSLYSVSISSRFITFKAYLAAFILRSKDLSISILSFNLYFHSVEFKKQLTIAFTNESMSLTKFTWSVNFITMLETWHWYWSMMSSSEEEKNLFLKSFKELALINFDCKKLLSEELNRRSRRS